MGHWHTPAAVIHFFQWTYLAGVTLTAISSGLAPTPDLRLAAAVFVPAAAYTILMVTQDGPHRLGHLGPIAVWLVCSSTVMVRALGRTANTCRMRPYTILASSNAGALLGVVVWLHPAHVPSYTSWIIVDAILLIIGACLLVLVRKLGVPQSLPQADRAGSVSKVRVGVVVIWFALAMSASLAMMLAQRMFAAMDTSSPSATALPLMVFLLAYVVGWSQAASLGTASNRHWYQQATAAALIAIWTLALEPSKAAISVVLYVFCATCVTLLRRFAPHPANATLFQIVQAAGGVFGGWLALHLQ